MAKKVIKSKSASVVKPKQALKKAAPSKKPPAKPTAKPKPAKASSAPAPKKKSAPAPAKPVAKKVATSKALAKTAPSKKAAIKSSPVKSVKASSSVPVKPKPAASRVIEKNKAPAQKDLPLKTSDKVKSKKKDKSKSRDSLKPVVRVVERKKSSEPVNIVPIKLSKEMMEIRAKLQTMLGEMRRDIDHEVRGASERDLAHINDTSDMASDAAEGDLALRIAESETVEAEEIERSIEKIDNGTYGVCEMCNKPIGVERIKFLPYVTLCIKCQELSEIRRREDGDELDDLAEGAETDNDA